MTQSNLPSSLDKRRASPQSSPSSLSQWISVYLTALNDRAAEIVLSRLGYFGRPPTLQQLGDDHGVTRERIRQIHRVAVKRWQGGLGLALHQHIVDLIGRSTDLVYVDLLPVYDPWFDLLDRPITFYEGLIRYLLDGKIFVVRQGNRRIVSRVADAEIENLTGLVVETASGMVGRGFDREAVGLCAKAIASNAGAPEIANLLLSNCEGILHFAPDNRQILVGVGKGTEAKAQAALRYAGKPVHYSEVPRLIERITGLLPDERTVHNALRTSGALLVGHGMYTLPELLDLDRSVCAEIVQEVIEVTRDGPVGKQWHCHELMEIVAEARGELPEITNPHVLSWILRDVSDLRYLGRQVWLYQHNEAPREVNRLDLLQACEAILEANGKPMSTTELRGKLRMSRGISTKFQIHPTGEIVQVGPGQWGLRVRDVGVPSDRQQECLDSLADQLESKAKAIHITEAHEIVEREPWRRYEADGYRIFGLARLDVRFRVYRGQYLGLSRWGEPRRLTVSGALQQLGVEEVRSLSEENLAARIAAIVEREVVDEELIGIAQKFEEPVGRP